MKKCLLQTDWAFPTSPANIFAAVRKHDIHTGMDIFTESGTQATSPFDGIVVKMGNFTGNDAEPTPSPWWNNTQYVVVKHFIPAFYTYGELVERFVLYGEIAISPELFVGKNVKEGELLGTIVEVLKNNKGLPTSMLHVEMYEECPPFPAIWNIGERRPTYLCDPHRFLSLCYMKNDIDYSSIMNQICKDYSINLQREFDNGCIEPNQGACYGSVLKRNGCIMLSKFDDPKLEFVAFFHELGHLLTSTLFKKPHCVSLMSYEGLAWEIGMDQAYRRGFDWEQDKQVQDYIGKCYSSYWNSERNNLKHFIVGEKHD